MKDGHPASRTPLRVHAYVAAVCGVAVICAYWIVSTPQSAGGLHVLPFTAAVVVAELLRTRIRFRGESLESTLTALPLVFGLVLSSNVEVLVAMVLGVAIARGVVRRQPLLKFVFNIANLTIDVVVTIAIADALSQPGSFGPREWVAVHLALAVSSVLSNALVVGVIAAATGSIEIPHRVLAGGLVVDAGTGSVAMAAVAVYRTDPVGLVLFLIPIGLVYGAIRAFERQRLDKERVEFLFRCTRSLTDSETIEHQLQAFLAQCVGGLRSECVELVVYSVEGQDFRFHAVATDDTHHVDSALPPSHSHDVLVGALAEVSDAPAIVRGAPTGSNAERLLAERSIGRGIIAPLARSDGAPFGLFIVGDLLGREAAYGDDDVSLVRALAELIGPIVASDQQSATIAELRTLRDELEFRATHDHLTGLPNRVLFQSTLDDIGRDTSPHRFGVLYIDLDGFKAVNDTHGHAAGDELLCAVARRLKSQVRTNDMAVRLGGDEFAVLVSSAPSLEEVENLGHRIVGTLSTPFELSCGPVCIGASVGIARGARGHGVDATVRDADAAMYEAKRSGKGRVVTAKAR